MTDGCLTLKMKCTKQRGRPPKGQLIVSESQLLEQREMVRQRKHRALVFRGRIIVQCASGLSNSAVAAALRTTAFTVGFWRKRFMQGGVAALWDEPRPGAPRQIGDEKVEAVIKATLETKPKAATHWSTRMMAERLGLSQSAISRIWRAFGLKPHRHQTFQISADPFFIEKVRDIVGLYMSPPTNALVLCVDEKSQIQALNRTQPILPMRPGQVERHTPEYQRNGTTSLFAALDVATGNVLGQCFRRHRSVEFKRFLDYVDSQVASGQEIHLILDNYGTHKTPAIKRWLQRHARYHLHFTPTHSSWINQVERWFALLSERQIKRGSHHSVQDLESAIKQFIQAHNEKPKPFLWTRAADEILKKLQRFAAETVAIQTQ
jgi:transposase